MIIIIAKKAFDWKCVTAPPLETFRRYPHHDISPYPWGLQKENGTLNYIEWEQLRQNGVCRSGQGQNRTTGSVGFSSGLTSMRIAPALPLPPTAGGARGVDGAGGADEQHAVRHCSAGLSAGEQCVLGEWGSPNMTVSELQHSSTLTAQRRTGGPGAAWFGKQTAHSCRGGKRSPHSRQRRAVAVCRGFSSTSRLPATFLQVVDVLRDDAA